MSYKIAKIIQKLVAMLPLAVIYVLGTLIGFILYLNPKKREIAFRNLKSVFPTKTNKEIGAIIKRSFNNLGLGLLESLIAERIFSRVELKGAENIQEGGGILVAVHEGSWELYNFVIAKNLRYKMFAKEQKKKSFEKFLGELRKKYSLDVCFSLKSALKSLNEDYLIGLVIDHGAEDNAIMVNFFSHLVPTPKGAVYLARKLNKKIYPCFGYRRNRFSHTIEIGKPIDCSGKDDYELLSALNGIYESYLTKHPWEYLWFYKRFKRKKNIAILILSDGKTGHIKQSKAFVSILKEMDIEVREQFIEVQPKNKTARIFSEICAFLSPKFCPACGKCLDFIISKTGSQKIQRTYSDIVVSAGSIVAPINRIVSSMLGAKSVVILRPNTPLRKFDLAIIPSHDRVESKNTVIIKGALSYPLDVAKKAEECKRFFHLSGDKKISFFMGGSLSDKKSYMHNLENFLKKLKEFSLKQNYKILISTSRRTHKEIEELIEKELRGFKNTETIVYPNRENYDFVFEGFAVNSEIVFVSSESISMISEVLALKQPCVSVLLEKHVDKHKVFLQSLENDVSFIDSPYDISEIKPRVSSIFETNKKMVLDGIRRLF